MPFPESEWAKIKMYFSDHHHACGGSASTVQRSIIDLSGICSFYKLRANPRIHNFISSETILEKCNAVGMVINKQISTCRHQMIMVSKCFRLGCYDQLVSQPFFCWTPVMALKSVTFPWHDHLVSALLEDLLSHSYSITFSVILFLYLVMLCLINCKFHFYVFILKLRYSKVSLIIRVINTRCYCSVAVEMGLSTLMLGSISWAVTHCMRLMEYQYQNMNMQDNQLQLE